jgi:hypothetical protein
MNKTKIRKTGRMAFAIVLLASGALAAAPDRLALCADRAAIERVYHAHRTGTKRPFEESMPPAMIEKAVRLDRHKEAVLSMYYKVEITPAMVSAEVQRIDTTTRAPEVLAEIKQALGDDPERFARSMARPIVVERELRHRFDTDDALHAARRKEAEQTRQKLLAGEEIEALHEVTWELTPRPADDQPDTRGTPPQTKGKSQGGLYAVEATAQVAQALSSPTGEGEKEHKFYFEEIDPELQKVLRVQLQKAGAVSAVIEMPNGFLVFVAKEKTTEQLSAASFSVSKRSYETWLEQQPEENP